jgi:glucose-1-phosphatase
MRRHPPPRVNPTPQPCRDIPVEAVVFDVGRVLIDYQYHDLIEFLTDRGLHCPSTHDLFERMDIDRYERGLIESDAFLANLNGLLEHPVPAGELARRWTRIFSPIPAMLELARRLGETSRVYLLSNASALHWEFLHERFDLGGIGLGQLASFQAGCRKPEPEIYRAAERQFDLDPGATVFIDDIAENAEGARACGWHAIHHQAPEDTHRRLAALPGPHRDMLG